MTSTGVRLLRPQQHTGSCLGLVVGIDVGTTFSGVSYAFLRPGEFPEVQPVTEFSDQAVGDAKIPSVIYYDEMGHVKAVGAATSSMKLEFDDEFYNWTKTKHFKLFFQPKNLELKSQPSRLERGPLPIGKTPEEVMGDFLSYLVAQTSRYIRNRHADGESLWDEVKDRAIFVLGHPNGWSGLPQQRMRRSAIIGGLVPDTADGHRRIKFITEGEASALACLSGGLGPTNLEPGFRFVIADAGGGTLDMTSFTVTKTTPLELKQITESDGREAGSGLVNEKAKELLKRKLRNSRYDNEDTLEDAISHFEDTTKREFSGEKGYVRVGQRRDRDDDLGIRGGHLKLEGEELAECFSPSVREAIDLIREQLRASNCKNMPVWLVGGFSSSPWLLKQLKESFELDGTSVQRPDTNLAKAVANGTILYFLDRPVTSRICKSSFGIKCSVPYNPLSPDHQNRENSVLIRPLSGKKMIRGAFDCILQKDKMIKEDEAFCMDYSREVLKSGAVFEENLFCHEATSPVPKWYKGNEESFRRICSLSADLTELCTSSSELISPISQKTYWMLEFQIELRYGPVLEARIKWEADGETKYGPVSIVYVE